MQMAIIYIDRRFLQRGILGTHTQHTASVANRESRERERIFFIYYIYVYARSIYRHKTLSFCILLLILFTGGWGNSCKLGIFWSC